MSACKIIAVANQKGGVAKSTTSYNFAACLSEAGKRVLLVDLDPQASLTILYGIDQPDELEFTVCDLMKACAEDKEMVAEACILHEHTVDLIPTRELSTLEISLVGVMSREHILKQVLTPLRSRYDYIIIDCPPSLGLLTVNALTACDRVLITTTPQFFSTKGLELLIDSIQRTRARLNPNIGVDGMLITMYAERTRIAKKIYEMTAEAFEGAVPIYKTVIPRSVQVDEANYAAESIVHYAPQGKVAQAYQSFCTEYLEGEKNE
ncbi:ParA family protein [Anaerotruncus colihominis]|uniref:Sporulation initiation inhibitor protein Soj n=1 Tax=Anaerotruncus colihominis TaxID=169435 RepID=A0A845RG17_9FIRM|nr:ParA family protein [Anaerotruncus colihominis]NBI78489.1 ParA family protein [Anaerotruncus colihominis]